MDLYGRPGEHEAGTIRKYPQVRGTWIRSASIRQPIYLSFSQQHPPLFLGLGKQGISENEDGSILRAWNGPRISSTEVV